eukprot:gb/GFBE01040272.1/.p1 GENE.gb/GFBE01040272.1/~~gb/GFBE01040272.1/.p1  ORF type:complete len:736 (+),score=90.09 gb/GFBE01040272.1/:1-2208(+)
MSWRPSYEEHVEPSPMAAALLQQRRSPASRASPSSAQATRCAECGNVFMADSNFCRRCGHRRDQVAVLSPKPEARLELPAVGQTLEDICDQIRMLRATVLPEGLRHAAFQGDTPEDRRRTARAASKSPLHDSHPPLSPRGQSLQPGSPPLATSQWLSPPASASSPARQQAFSSHQASTPSRPATQRIKPCSPFRLTLWEERQLFRCIHAWRRFAKDELSTLPSASDPGAQLLSTVAPEVASRVDRCFRAWQRLTAATKAREIELAVQLLDSQVERHVSRGIRHWRLWAGKVPGRNDRRRFQTCLRRLALQRWRSVTVEREQRRELCDQASALMRVHVLRRSLRCLASRSQSQDRSRVHSAAERLRKQREVACKQYALRRFQALTGKARQKAFTNDVAHVHAKDRMRLACLRRWSRWCRQRLSRRAALQGHLQNRVRPRHLRQSFHVWASHAREEQRNQATLHKARIVLDLSLKGRVFHGWLMRRQSSVRAESKLQALSGGVTHSFQVLLLSRWHVIAARLSAENAALIRVSDGISRMLQSRCMSRLREHMLESCRSEQQHAAATSLHSRRVQREGLVLWRRVARDERHERTQTKLASTHRTRAETVRGFRMWYTALVEGKLEKQQTGLANKQRSAHMASASWARWASYTQTRCRRRRFLEPRRKALEQAPGARGSSECSKSGGCVRGRCRLLRSGVRSNRDIDSALSVCMFFNCAAGMLRPCSAGSGCMLQYGTA